MKNSENNYSPLQKQKLQPLLYSQRNSRNSLKGENFSFKIKSKEINRKECKVNCIATCDKTKFKDYIKLDFEEINKNNQTEFSAKSIVVYVLSILLNSLNTLFYRKITNMIIEQSNLNKTSIKLDNSEFLLEYVIFCWRYQSIFVFLIIYILIANYFIKNNFIEDTTVHRSSYRNLPVKDKSNYIDFNQIHFTNIKFSELMTTKYLKMSSLNIISSFIFLLSTKNLPISFCLIFFHSAHIINFIMYNKKTTKKKFKFFIFLIVSIFLFVAFLIEGMDELYSHSQKFDTNANVGANSNGTYMRERILSIMGCITSSCIIYFSYKNKVKELMDSYSPIESILIINLNSLILSCFLLVVIGLYCKIFYNNNFELITNSFGWIYNIEVYPLVGLGFGILGLLNIIFSLLSSVYLKVNFIKLYKIIEIPFADVLSIFLFNLYELPNDYYYYIVIFNFLVTFAIVEFSNSKKNKI